MPGDETTYVVKRSTGTSRYVFKVMKTLPSVQVFDKPFRPSPGFTSSLKAMNGDEPLVGSVAEVETYVDGKKTDQTTWVLFKSDGFQLGIRHQNFRNFAEKLHFIDLLREE